LCGEREKNEKKKNTKSTQEMSGANVVSHSSSFCFNESAIFS